MSRQDRLKSKNSQDSSEIRGGAFTRLRRAPLQPSAAARQTFRRCAATIARFHAPIASASLRDLHLEMPRCSEARTATKRSTCALLKTHHNLPDVRMLPELSARVTKI